MQYYFAYIERLKERPKISLALGSGGHSALEKSVKRKIKTGETVSAHEVVEWASDFMDLELRAVPMSEIEKDLEPGQGKDRFLAALHVYQKEKAPLITPIGAEIEFNLDMNEYQDEPLEYPIKIVNGKIDILYDDIETLVTPYADMTRVAVEDFKFAAKKKNVREVNLSTQLSLYGIVVHKLTGRWPTKVGLQQMYPGNTKETPGPIQLLREPHLTTPEAWTARLRRVAFQFRQVSEGIRLGVFIPTDDPITCSWCGYQDRCQASQVTDLEAAEIRSKTANPAA